MVTTTFPRTSHLTPTWTPTPASSFSALRSDLDRFFDEFWRRSGYSNPSAPWAQSNAFYPSVNVSETIEGYRVTADLPGLRREDVTLSIEGDALVISGSRAEETKDVGRNYICRECVGGEFRRVVNIGDADVEKAHATMTNGVLNVEIPKSPSSSRRRTIPIESSGSTTSSSSRSSRGNP
jgi:HSP20 family protein